MTNNATLPTNPLIRDQWFTAYPDKVLGEVTQKKRGDRGPDAFEWIVKGNLPSAMVRLNHLNVPVTEARSIKPKGNNSEAERLRLLDLSLKLELELLELELEL